MYQFEKNRDPSDQPWAIYKVPSVARVPALWIWSTGNSLRRVCCLAAGHCDRRQSEGVVHELRAFDVKVKSSESKGVRFACTLIRQRC